MLVLHFLCENLASVCGRLYSELDSVSLTCLHSGNEGTDTYAHGTKIGTFIDLDEGIHAALCLHDFVNLICCYGIKTTTERCKLNKFHVCHFTYKGTSSIKSVVV